MRYGFTGTQVGMSGNQFKETRLLLEGDWTEFHHGCCDGSDEEAAFIASQVRDRVKDGRRIYAHLGDTPNKRSMAALKASDVFIEEKGNLERNQDIVNVCDEMIATPRLPEKSQPRSGTWATIRRARKAKKLVHQLER